jgi:hypothetical protein
MITTIQGPERCIIDAGMKVLTSDIGMPKLCTRDGITLVRLNEK